VNPALRSPSRTILALSTLLALPFITPTHRSHAASPLPQPLPGWRIEVLAEAPNITHPTVAAAAPDGRVFVAEDPMDIRTPRADATEGRILCLHPDGRLTVFADRLHAVFGLQVLDGKVYVLHNPKFSVFDDVQSVGQNRRDLIQQTLPEPWALNWNDHVPANFHLAMDGFFYAASGDKGLFNAQGTDGSRANLSTGGIFRIRPDGSGLEVLSHGVRNILDVALNSQDEQFTYDNTDEHDWMGRFTHMVEAGYYGYPHHFNPRQPYTLWMIDDYGAGAACGVFANTEDGLPPEFHDNLFLSDFGKRQIMRVRVQRDGASYRAVSKEDLFPNPPGDFRPVGITPSIDGKSLYICDWQYRDEKADVKVGRLLKLTWIGSQHGSPKPAWFVPAASGQPFQATTPDLVQALSHPSRLVRLTAQRRLSERASSTTSTPTEVVNALTNLLANAKASSIARSHALWALDSLNNPTHTSASFQTAANDPDPNLLRQTARQIGLRRSTNGIPTLSRLLQHSDASVRFQAATALGRLGDPRAVPSLLASLQRQPQDLFARYAAFTALNRIGTNAPTAWSNIVQGLEHPSPQVSEATASALRDTYDPQLAEVLIRIFRDSSKPLKTRLTSLSLLSLMHHQPPAWKGQWWAYHPALQPPPEKTVAWSATEIILKAMRDGLQESSPTLRRGCIQALALAKNRASAPALRALYPTETDPATLATILRALGSIQDPQAISLAASALRSNRDPELTHAAIETAAQIASPEAVQALADFVNTPTESHESLALAVHALGSLKAIPTSSTIAALSQHDSHLVRVAALTASAQLQGLTAIPLLTTSLQDPVTDVRLAAVKALADLKSTNTIPALLQAHLDPDLRPDAFRGLTRTPDPRALDVLLDGLASRNPTQRNAAHLAVRNIQSNVLKSIQARADSLPPQALSELRQIYAGNPEAEAGPLFAKSIQKHSLDEYLQAAIQIPGDPSRGETLFREPNGVNCIACHRVQQLGSDLGPDLSSIGTQFDRRALAESILYPSKTVREGYQQITVALADEEELSGVVKGETAEVLILRDSSGREHRIPRASIKSRTNSATSIMPEGLQSALSLEEFADLIRYLTTLK